MKFCSRFTWPLTSVSAVTPSHWTSTSPSAFWAAHWAPRRTCSQKSNPIAFGTTASWTGAFAPFPSPPPWPPPPPDSRTCAPQATAATRAREAARSTAKICLRIDSSFTFLAFLLRRRGGPAARVLIPDHRQPDDDADDHLLVEGVYVEQDGAVADQGNEEGPDQGAHHGSLPPEEARPADDGGRDHVKLEPDAEVRLPRVDPRGGYHATEARQGARDHVDAGQVAPDRDPREPGGLEVRAHRVGVAPQPRAREHDVPGDRNDHDHEDGDRDRPDDPLSKEPEGVRRAENGDRVGDDKGKAPGDGEHAQRGDKRVETCYRDEEPVDEPADRADQGAAEDREWNRQAGLTHHHHADHARESRHRTHGEVYARRDDDQRHADGYDGGDRGLGADVEEVVGREKDGGGEREEDKDHYQGAGGGELGDGAGESLAQGASAAFLGRCGAAHAAPSLAPVASAITRSSENSPRDITPATSPSCITRIRSHMFKSSGM